MWHWKLEKLCWKFSFASQEKNYILKYIKIEISQKIVIIFHNITVVKCKSFCILYKYIILIVNCDLFDELLSHKNENNLEFNQLSFFSDIFTGKQKIIFLQIITMVCICEYQPTPQYCVKADKPQTRTHEKTLRVFKTYFISPFIHLSCKTRTYSLHLIYVSKRRK